MDRMRCCQPAAFKTHPAQIGVGFDNFFQRRRDDMLLRRQHRFFTFFNQRVVAQLSQRQRRLSAFASGHCRGAAA